MWTEAARSSCGTKIESVLKRDEIRFSTFWRLQAIGWLGLYALVMLDALSYINRGPSGPWSAIRDKTIVCGLLFLASCALRPVCRSLVRRSLPWFRLQLRAFGWASLAGTTVAVLTQFVALHFPKPNWADLINNYLRYSIFILFWCNLYFSIKHRQHSAQERERLARAEADAREARLGALRYQLNPHFLFNSLNAVSTLAVEGDIPGVTRMLAQIAELLRTTLDKDLPWEVSLSDEMAFTERYLAIEQAQLGERLRVDLEIAADTLDAAVPSMLPQPLVENAIRHGVAPVIEGGCVTIRSELHGLHLRIVIRNTGPRDPRPRTTATGIGLANTSERLQTLYGTDHRFDLQWPETGGCEVLIEVPFRKVAPRAEALECAH